MCHRGWSSATQCVCVCLQIFCTKCEREKKSETKIEISELSWEIKYSITLAIGCYRNKPYIDILAFRTDGGCGCGWWWWWLWYSPRIVVCLWPEITTCGFLCQHICFGWLLLLLLLLMLARLTVLQCESINLFLISNIYNYRSLSFFIVYSSIFRFHC